MKALFVELPPFERYREQYMDDAAFSAFQAELIKNPEAGDVIAGTGGLRKVRHGVHDAAKANVEDCALSTTGGSAASSSGSSPCITRMK